MWRGPKPGLSKEEWERIDANLPIEDIGKPSYDEWAKRYDENTIPSVCEHAEPLVTVLKRRRDFNKIGGEKEEATEEYGWIISFAAASERRPQQQCF